MNTLFAFDYDGTLAPITSDPKWAYMRGETATLLNQINEIAPVAIITGRSVQDVERLLPFRPKFIVGNHGPEGICSDAELRNMYQLTRNWLKEIEPARASLGHLGISVEDKMYSLSFHYRNSSNPTASLGALEFTLSKLPEARLVEGAFVINVVPDFGLDKGSALDILMKSNGFSFATFFGDDQTDEDVFDYNDPRVLTVKIGTGASRAKYNLNSQREIDEVLKLISNHLKKA